VFHDINNNAVLDEEESVIHARPALPDGFRVTGNGPVSRYIAYTPTGATKLISARFRQGG